MNKGGRPKGSSDKIQVIYAAYKGDTFIDVGTRRELAQSLGIAEDTITFYGSPSYNKRVKKSEYGRIEIIKIGKEKIK